MYKIVIAILMCWAAYRLAYAMLGPMSTLQLTILFIICLALVFAWFYLKDYQRKHHEAQNQPVRTGDDNTRTGTGP